MESTKSSLHHHSLRTVILSSPFESIRKKEGEERKKAVNSVYDSCQLFKYLYLVGGPAGASNLVPWERRLPIIKPGSFIPARLGSTNLSTQYMYDSER